MVKSIHVSSVIGVGTFIVGMSFATATLAQNVVLNSSDGSLTIEGEFVSLVDGQYTVLTTLGEMVLDASVVSCAGTGCPVIVPEVIEADVVLAGSDTIGIGLMPLLLSGYANSSGGIAESYEATDGSIVTQIIQDDGYGELGGAYQVVSTGSSDAFSTLLDGSADIGMASRRIRRAEARELSAAGAGRLAAPGQEHIIAVDSLVVIVNPLNPVTSISISNLAAIYRGEITNWSQLGGNDEQITAYTRPDNSGTRAIFDNRIHGSTEQIQVARILQNNTETADRILSNTAAIGYVGFAFQNGAKPLSLITECNLQVSANAFSAKTEEYPLNRRLYLYTREQNLSEHTQSFIDYAISVDADGVVAKAGYIDLGVSRASQTDTQARLSDLISITSNQYELSAMRNLMVELRSWDRLSTTFRFSSGSDRLEQKASLDLIRLRDYLSAQPTGTEVALVGYTDSEGAFSANQIISEQRGNTVKDAINEFAGDQLSHITFTPMGFGELSPAACNNERNGRQINRRVEVWIRNTG